MKARKRNFWDTLPRPFYLLAPLADVTDAVFRKLIARYSRMGQPGGGPDAMWTEFVSADGLSSPGKEQLLTDLRYTEEERPIVAQLFSADPNAMKEAAALARERGFDGIDINMGCPERSIVKQGAGCGLIKTPEHAQTIVAAAQAGAGELPVSVKTRIGFNTNEIATWVPTLLSCDIAALTMHFRTRKEMSKVPARWEHMREIVRLRDKQAPHTYIVGNGDATSLADAKEKLATYGGDGVMLGRAIFGNPWLFDTQRAYDEIGIAERLGVMVEHTKLFEAELGAVKNFAIMKKHYKAYVNGFDGAKELRVQLMEAPDAATVAEITKEFLTEHKYIA